MEFGHTSTVQGTYHPINHLGDGKSKTFSKQVSSLIDGKKPRCEEFEHSGLTLYKLNSGTCKVDGQPNGQ